MQIYRSALLRFTQDGQAVYDEDGLLAIAPDAQGRARVQAAGSWQALRARYEGHTVTHWPGRIMVLNRSGSRTVTERMSRRSLRKISMNDAAVL